jgi:hypothetical protein
MPKLFAEIGAAAALRDLIPLVESWRPDLIVYETFELAASLAGAVAGVPTVHHTISPLPPAEATQLTSAAMAPLWRTHGRLPDPSRELCIDICPPSLRNPAADPPIKVQPLRPVATTVHGAASPDWDTELPAGPLVHVTFGTQRQPEDDAALMTLLDGLTSSSTPSSADAEGWLTCCRPADSLRPLHAGPFRPCSLTGRATPQLERWLQRSPRCLHPARW